MKISFVVAFHRSQDGRTQRHLQGLRDRRQGGGDSREGEGGIGKEKGGTQGLDRIKKMPVTRDLPWESLEEVEGGEAGKAHRPLLSPSERLGEKF